LIQDVFRLYSLAIVLI